MSFLSTPAEMMLSMVDTIATASFFAAMSAQTLIES
jgi:hypothetical protein